VKRKADQPSSTSFDAYLKVARPAHSPTSFDAYLKTTVSQEVKGDDSSAAGDASGPRDDQVCSLYFEEHRQPI
jgi:hypothetical protein